MVLMKIRNLAAIALLGLTLPLVGQSAPSPVQAKPAVQTQAVPELTTTEKLAVKSLQDEFSELSAMQVQASKDLTDFQNEVSANHPGYIFDVLTLKLKAAPKDESKDKK